MGSAVHVVASCGPPLPCVPPLPQPVIVLLFVFFSSPLPSGVLFCEWPDGSRAVLKGSTETARELFCTRVLRTLGLRAPHARLVRYSDVEYARMQEAVVRCCRDQGDLLYRAQKNLKRPQVLLFEFVAGMSPLQKMGLLKDAAVMEELGRVTAVDAVLNNVDRLPLGIWNNEGNLGNVMLSEDGHDVIVIDTAMFAIKPEVAGRPNLQYSRYRERLVDLARNPSPAIETMRTRCFECWGVELGPSKAFEKGLREMLQRLRDLPVDFFELHKREIEGFVDSDWENVWAKDVAQIDLKFIKAMIEAISDV